MCMEESGRFDVLDVMLASWPCGTVACESSLLLYMALLWAVVGEWGLRCDFSLDPEAGLLGGRMDVDPESLLVGEVGVPRLSVTDISAAMGDGPPCDDPPSGGVPAAAWLLIGDVAVLGGREPLNPPAVMVSFNASAWLCIHCCRCCCSSLSLL